MDLRQIEAKVRQRLRASGINPRLEPAVLSAIVDEEVAAFELGSLKNAADDSLDLSELKAQIRADIAGFGSLQKYLDDPEVEEIWGNSPGKIFVARQGRSELTVEVLEDVEVRDLVERMLQSSGRRIDLSNPFVDATLPTGERLHVVIPPITAKHWAFNIRKHLHAGHGLRQLVQLRSLTTGLADFLGAAVAAGLTVLVSGATQAGKTTMARALCASIPAAERIITCEEVFELGLTNHDVVALQTRPPTLEGKGEVPLRALVKESLRMRPERLIIGEVRGAESLDMIIALNAGVPGMCTLHANSAREALRKLCVLPLLAGENVTSAFVVPTVAAAVDLVVHLNRNRHGKRYVAEVLSVTGRVENGLIEAATLYSSDGNVARSGTNDFADAERLRQHGYDAAALLARVGS